jgi:hypothetical protein
MAAAIPVAPEGTVTKEMVLARLAETRATLLEKTRYPMESRPLAMKTDLMLPHHVEPTLRGLSEKGQVGIQQTQDRLYISPGEPATVAVKAMLSDGSPATIDFDRSDLVRRVSGQPDRVVGHVTFSDDGSPPDELAGDGVWTGLVATPTDGVPAELALLVGVRAGSEAGTLNYSFVQTASPPAVFTQTGRDALEQGSIALYVGVQVAVPGTYEVVGRLYDSVGAPIAYMRFLDVLGAGSQQVRLLAFGAVILDQGAVPPFVLRDVEGSRMVLGQYPDREIMTPWAGPYTTAPYPLAALDGAAYDGQDKQQRIQALDKATQEAMANLEATATKGRSAGVGP